MPGVVLQPVHQHHQELVPQILQRSRHLQQKINKNFLGSVLWCRFYFFKSFQ